MSPESPNARLVLVPVEELWTYHLPVVGRNTAISDDPSPSKSPGTCGDVEATGNSTTSLLCASARKTSPAPSSATPNGRLRLVKGNTSGVLDPFTSSRTSPS